MMSKHKSGMMLGTMRRMNHLTILCIFSHQRFSNCSSTMDVGFVKLSLDNFC